jgi:hypothetical protein
MAWKVTATKLYCDIVKAWVTVMVYRDGTTKCGYCERYLSKPGSSDQKKLCDDHCKLLTAYREDVFQREKTAD